MLSESAWNYRVFLSAELERRCLQNPRYSLRSFARVLKLTPGTLSNILSSKRNLGLSKAKEVVQCLSLGPVEANRFLRDVASQKMNHLGMPSEDIQPLDIERQFLDEEQFKLISEWHHLAILQLLSVKQFVSDFKWIAIQLQISEIQARLAVGRLERLGLMTTKRPRWKRRVKPLDTGDRSKTFAALKHFQAQMLEKATHSLKNDPIEERNHLGMTMAIDPQKIPEAKKLMVRFLEELSSLVESGTKTRVYQASFQLFPLQTSQIQEKRK